MRAKIALIFAMLIVFCGCAEDSVDSSFRAPALPEEYVEFNDEIEKIKQEGLELISPNGGTNRQSVQLTDLDGDGIDEGIAFFKETGSGYKVYAYFFKKNDDGYEIKAKVEGSGDSIENVAYADILGNGNNEVIIGWSLADSGAKSVSAYAIENDAAVKLCEMNSIYHTVCDMDGDMVSDLCVIYDDPAESVQKLAMYSQKDGTMEVRSTAPLSASSDTILRIRYAFIEDIVPALFVEKRYDSAGVITDIITWNGEQLENITYSPETAQSDKTARISEIYCEDIDGDSNLEIPTIKQPAIMYDVVENEVLTCIAWYGINNGKYEKESILVRSSVEKWDITIPLDWEDKCVAVYRGDTSAKITTFYGEKEGAVGEELFSIITITGENREKSLEKAGYEKLIDSNNVLYGIKINKKRYLGYDINAQMIRERFSRRNTEWSTGEVVY